MLLLKTLPIMGQSDVMPLLVCSLKYAMVSPPLFSPKVFQPKLIMRKLSYKFKMLDLQNKQPELFPKKLISWKMNKLGSQF